VKRTQDQFYSTRPLLFTAEATLDIPKQLRSKALK